MNILLGEKIESRRDLYVGSIAKIIGAISDGLGRRLHRYSDYLFGVDVVDEVISSKALRKECVACIR